MSGHTREDRIRNKCIREKVGVVPIVEKIVESHLRWFWHVWRRPVKVPVRSIVVSIGWHGRLWWKPWRTEIIHIFIQ